MGDPPLLVSFTNTSSVGTVEFNWDFADSNFSQLENPTNTFQDTGIYYIQLTVRDTNSCVDSISRALFVKNASIDIAIIDVKTTVDAENYLHVRTDLQNKSTRIITAIDLYSTLNGLTPIKETWTGLLPINSYLTFDFAGSTKILNSQNNFVCVDALHPNKVDDYFPTDNNLCISITDNAFTVSEPYPNPTFNEIIFPVIVPDESSVNLRLYNSKGVLVLNEKYNCTKGLNRLTINMTGFPEGIYAMQIALKEKLVAKRFVKISEKQN